MMEFEEWITTAEFVALLWEKLTERQGLSEAQNSINEEEIPEEAMAVAVKVTTEVTAKAVMKITTETAMKIAARHGVVDARDELEAGKSIERAVAARILHEFMVRELGESDLVDVKKANELRDLYDCHVCVNHVAQVYCKEIMPAWREGIFGMRERLQKREALEILGRLFSQERRSEQGDQTKLREERRDSENDIRELPFSSVKTFLLEYPKTAHLDVRTPWEFANGHANDAKNIPLFRLLENPGLLDLPKNEPILIGCDGGYRSKMAAHCLLASGYQRVYYYGFDKDAFTV